MSSNGEERPSSIACTSSRRWERGIAVSCETVRRWVANFGAYHAEELRRHAVQAGRTRHLDGMGVRIGGVLRSSWRAVGEHGRTLDLLLQAHPETAAAERFFRRPRSGAGGTAPAHITTDE